MSLLKLVFNHIQSVSTLRRLLFAVIFYPVSYLIFWGVALELATSGSIDKSDIDALIEKIESFDQSALHKDEKLKYELLESNGSNKKPLGMVLISSKKFCCVYGGDLILRKDRAASFVVYDDQLGSCSGSHFHKMCQEIMCIATILWLPHWYYWV